MSCELHIYIIFQFQRGVPIRTSVNEAPLQCEPSPLPSNPPWSIQLRREPRLWMENETKLSDLIQVVQEFLKEQDKNGRRPILSLSQSDVALLSVN